MSDPGPSVGQRSPGGSRPAGTRRKYAPSTKRAATTEAARERIRHAAWRAFASEGLDAASIAGIVRESGVSTGSFYNHFGSKEMLFDAFLEELAEDVRDLTAQARAEADDLETMLRISFEALLDHVVAVEGARELIARNQHHIRASLHRFDAMEEMLGDLRGDVARGTGGALGPDELDLVARMIFSIGLETVLQLGADRDGPGRNTPNPSTPGRSTPGTDTAKAAALMTAMIVRGVEGLGLAKR